MLQGVRISSAVLRCAQKARISVSRALSFPVEGRTISMRPRIVPGFLGFLPEVIADLHPESSTFSVCMDHWPRHRPEKIIEAAFPQIAETNDGSFEVK